MRLTGRQAMEGVTSVGAAEDAKSKPAAKDEEAAEGGKAEVSRTSLWQVSSSSFQVKLGPDLHGGSLSVCHLPLLDVRGAAWRGGQGYHDSRRAGGCRVRSSELLVDPLYWLIPSVSADHCGAHDRFVWVQARCHVCGP